MLTGPSYFRRSCPRTRHRRRSARSSERLGFKESKADISASRRRDLKQSATPSPTPLPVKRCGYTRNFRRGLTIAVTRKTPSQSTRCLTISVYIGSQILQRRLLGYTGKTPRVVVQASQLGASSCRCYSSRRCGTHSSHGEDDRPRHLGNFCHYLRRTGGWRRAGLRESFDE